MSKKKFNEVLSLAETAEFIGITKEGVRRAIVERRTLPGKKIGNQWTVKLSAAKNYKKQNKGKPGRPKNKQMKLKF